MQRTRRGQTEQTVSVPRVGRPACPGERSATHAASRSEKRRAEFIDGPVVDAGSVLTQSIKAGGAIVESPKSKATEELVRLAQDGQSPALEALFGRFRPRVVDLARRRMGGRLSAKEDPEDLAQTTFREAVRDFSGYEYRGKRSFFGWLSRILSNKIRDRAEYHSATKRDSSREIGLVRTSASGQEYALEPVASGLTILEQVEFKEELELLHRNLDLLPEVHREAIRLVYYEGLSLRQAGARLDYRSEAAVRMLIRRAAVRLRESLKGSFDKE